MNSRILIRLLFGVEDELLTNTNQDGVTDALTFERAISENINLSQYVVGNAHAPEFHYYVKSAEDYNVFSENGTKVQADEEREGYGLVRFGSGQNCKLVFKEAL